MHILIQIVAKHVVPLSLSPHPVQDKPEALKAELEGFLAARGVPYSYSTKSKFANFKDKTLE